MHVLVAYASRHGATAGIAERIAAGLRAARIRAEARPIDEVTDLSAYDAFVIGSAAYMFHWLKEATAFVERLEALLASRPVWLFSSGPLGTDLVDEDGRDVVEVTRPKELDAIAARLGARDVRVFFGAWDPDAPPVGLGERLFRMLPGSSEALPAGDFRDWEAIDAWAEQIADELRTTDTGSQA